MDWSKERVLVTGGCSFIGSHLVEELRRRGAEHIRIADDRSAGKWMPPDDRGSVIEFLWLDLKDPRNCDAATQDITTVFHLAADHGGRGYVDTHNWDCSTNLALDSNVFQACKQNDVERIVYASSGCVYPNHLQTDVTRELYLTEDMVGPPYDADNMYGWAKLMGEMTLKHMHRELGIATASCRYFTVFGPRGKVDHALIAMIARAHAGQNPFIVWGDGQQIRNWTYVDDIVRGTILAAERIETGIAVNLGTEERTRVIDAAARVCSIAGHKPTFEFVKNAPTGPVNRVASNERARKILDWSPAVGINEGLQRTWDWFAGVYSPKEAAKMVENDLLKR